MVICHKRAKFPGTSSNKKSGAATYAYQLFLYLCQQKGRPSTVNVRYK